MEAIRISEDDSILVVGSIYQSDPLLELVIYDDENISMYTHHDIYVSIKQSNS